MDTNLIVQITFLFVIFILCFFCVLLPTKLVPHEPNDISERSLRILSFCNCFACGVFLGTCFLQLIPFIEDKFNYVFFHYGVNLSYTCPVTQVLVMLGFFMILLIEQSVRICQKHSTHSISEALQLSTTQLSSNPSDTESDDGESYGGSEKKHMLKRNSAKQPTSYVDLTSEVSESSSNNRQPAEVAGWVKELPSQGQGNHQVTVHEKPAGCGHSHLTDVLKNDFGLRCFLLLMALSIHCLFEGITVGLQGDLYQTITLFVGIALHEVFMCLAMGISLAQQRLQLVTTVKLCLFFSMTIPAGMLIGMLIGGCQSLACQTISAVFQGITAGTFVYVTFLELLPAEINLPKHRMLKVFFIFLGFAFMASLKFGMKDEMSDQVYYHPMSVVG